MGIGSTFLSFLSCSLFLSVKQPEIKAGFFFTFYFYIAFFNALVIKQTEQYHCMLSGSALDLHIFQNDCFCFLGLWFYFSIAPEFSTAGAFSVIFLRNRKPFAISCSFRYDCITFSTPGMHQEETKCGLVF